MGGSTPSTKEPDNFNGNIPWLTPKDLSGVHDRYIARGARNLSQKGLDSCSAKLVPANTVLLSTRAPIGYVAIAANPISTNQGFRNLVAHKTICPEFIYYWLKNNTETLEHHASGSTFKEISGSALKKIRLRLPLLPEQRAIAHILGTLDDKIELNRRMNETLEEMARALFKDWFVDFGPVRAKMEGRWRRGESLPGLPAELYDLFPDRLVESELGEAPERWEVKALGDLCQKPQYGFTASAQVKPVGPKFLRITDINKDSWVSWSRVPYCMATHEEFSKYQLSKGDILIARMADPGHGIMVEDELKAVFASYLIRFRPIESRTERFLQYWLRSDAYWQLARGRAAGTTRRSLNAKVLSQFPIIAPSTPIAAAFANAVGAWRNRLVKNVEEIENLTTLRNTLSPQLIYGKLKYI